MDRIDQADAIRLVGMHLESRVDHLRRETWTDEPRQPLRAAPAGWNPQADFRLREARVLRGEANIAGDSQLATTTKCVAVDRGDHRLRQTLDGAGERLSLATECQALCRSEIDHLLDIGARGERAIPGSCQDDDPDRAILTERVERSPQEVELLGVERVERLWAVHRDDRDAVVDLDVNRHVSLFPDQGPRRRPGRRRRCARSGARSLATRTAPRPRANASLEPAHPS